MVCFSGLQDGDKDVHGRRHLPHKNEGKKEGEAETVMTKKNKDIKIKTKKSVKSQKKTYGE